MDSQQNKHPHGSIQATKRQKNVSSEPSNPAASQTFYRLTVMYKYSLAQSSMLTCSERLLEGVDKALCNPTTISTFNIIGLIKSKVILSAPHTQNTEGWNKHLHDGIQLLIRLIVDFRSVLSNLFTFMVLTFDKMFLFFVCTPCWSVSANVKSLFSSLDSGTDVNTLNSI